MKKILLAGACLLLASPALAGVAFPPGSSGSGGVGTSTSGQILTNSAGAVAGMTGYAASGDLSLSPTGVTQLNAIQGVAVGTPTGSGSVVLANGPAFTGPVGIGTTANATYPLTIYETSSAGSMIMGTIQDASHNAISLNGSTASGYVNFASGAGDDNLYINRPTGFKIYFREGWSATEDTLLPGTGAIIIGTSSTSAVANAMMTLYGGANIGAAYVAATPPANGAVIQGNVSIGTSANSYPLQVIGTASASSFYAGSTAGVTCSGTPTSSFAAANGIVTHC